METERRERKKIIKVLYIIAGVIFTGLGIIGIILPILPTTALNIGII